MQTVTLTKAALLRRDVIVQLKKNLDIHASVASTRFNRMLNKASNKLEINSANRALSSELANINGARMHVCQFGSDSLEVATANLEKDFVRVLSTFVPTVKSHRTK